MPNPAGDDPSSVRRLVGRGARRASVWLDRAQAHLLTSGTLEQRATRLADESRRREAPAVAADRRAARLVEMYTRLRAASGVPTAQAPPSASVPPGAAPLPRIGQIARVESELLGITAAAAFFDILSQQGDVASACVRTIRALLRVNASVRATVLVNLLAAPDSICDRTTSDVCRALLAMQPHLYSADTAALFDAHPLAEVVRLAPSEFLRLNFARDPERAADVLARIRAGELDVSADVYEWFDISRTAFAANHHDLSRWALEHTWALAREAVGTDVGASWAAGEPPSDAVVRRTDPAALRALLDEARWLTQWFDRTPGVAPQPPTGTVSFGVIDYTQPDWRRACDSSENYVESLGALTILAARRDIRFTGDSALAEVARSLQRRAVGGDNVAAVPVQLYPVSRDVSALSHVPDPTWELVVGWHDHDTFDMPRRAAFNPQIRPIHVSMHLTAKALTPAWIEQLRRYAPVGCRDWTTVHLLLAADVPAFFSGDIATAVGSLGAPTHPTGEDPGTDATAPRPPRVLRRRGLARNVTDTVAYLDAMRATPGVVPAGLRSWLAARSLGLVTEPPSVAPGIMDDGLIDLSVEQVEAMGRRLHTRLSAVVDLILTGADEDAVYRRWRELCADDVAAARAAHRTDDIPPPTFDVAATCAQIRGRAVSIERTVLQPDSSEIHVEFSLDKNLKHQLAVVLDSIVSRCSRPVRAYVLCRDHGPDDFARMARLFPSVSFVWLPTDGVTYGEAGVNLRHITIATMDRLLLPELLPDVARIVHHDLDALCVADLAELYDTDLQGTRLAARDSPHPNSGRGYLAVTRSALRITDLDIAREYILQTHTRNAYDYQLLNAGILVLDLDRMRRDQFCRYFLPYAERYGFNDQEILNVYAGAERVSLDTGWNYWPRRDVVGTPRILHWLGPMKPWNSTYVIGRERWREADEALCTRMAAMDKPSDAS